MTQASRSGPRFDLSNLEMLFAGHAPRLAHMRDASSFAADLAACSFMPMEQSELLVRSALLHDLGYAPSLRRYGFHPLDGALFLESQDEHPWVIEGVLRHSGADRRASLLPEVAEQYAMRPVAVGAAWLVRAVTMADWRAAGIGGRVSFGQRLRDIVDRNPDNPGKVRRAEAMVAEVRGWFLDWVKTTNRARPLPWVFCDVDHTLICPGDPLSAGNRTSIKAYVAAGGRFSLASGKHPKSVASLSRDLGLESAQVAANGTCVFKGGVITVLAHLGDAAMSLVARLKALGLPVALYREQGIEACCNWEDCLDELFVRYGEIRAERKRGSGPVLKILCVAHSADQELERDLRRLAVSLEVEVCRSDTRFMEFLPTAGTKGHAVRFVTQHEDWPVLHTLALGDTENDAAMFAQCGGCAAVANATGQALLGADWVIPECAADGVGRVLDVVRQGGGWGGLALSLQVEGL